MYRLKLLISISGGKIKPDLEVPVGEKRSFKYFREETVKKYASEFGWI